MGFGFFLLIVLNVALGLAAGAVALRVILSQPNVDPSDGEALTRAVFDRVPGILMSGPGVLASGLTMWAAFFLAPWLATRNKGLKSLAVDFGFRVKWRRDLLMGATFALGLRVA